MSSLQGSTPLWWMDAGPDLCPHCGHPHQIEALLHCYLCDGPVCVLCTLVVDVDAGTVCPDCDGPAKEAD